MIRRDREMKHCIMNRLLRCLVLCEIDLEYCMQCFLWSYLVLHMQYSGLSICFFGRKQICLTKYEDWDVKKWTQNKSSWDNSVDTAAGYRLDGPSSIPGSARFFSPPQCPGPGQLWGPPSLRPKRGTGGRVKRHGHVVDHSPPSSAGVKKSGALPPPQYVFMA
jgi:hypothetical protein